MPGRAGLCPEQTCARLSLQADLHSFAQNNPSGNVTPCTKMLSERTPVTPVVLQSTAETRGLRWKGKTSCGGGDGKNMPSCGLWNVLWNEIEFAEVSTQTTEEKILLQHMLLVCMLNYFCFNFFFFNVQIFVCYIMQYKKQTLAVNQNKICMRQGGFCAFILLLFSLFCFCLFICFLIT